MRYSKELMPTLPPAVKTLPQLMGKKDITQEILRDLVEQERMTGSLKHQEILGYSLMAKVSQKPAILCSSQLKESHRVSILQKHSQREDRYSSLLSRSPGNPK